MAIDLGSVIDFHENNDKPKQSAAHNAGILKCVFGGLRMAESHRVDFDPRADYWRRPERRLTAAYLASKWTGRFAPPSCVRATALRLLSHMDRARTDGVVSYFGVDYHKTEGGLPAICGALADHARRASPIPEWERLREIWPHLSSSAGDDLAVFLENVGGTDNWDAGYRLRLPWFGYLGTASEEQLASRQAFYFGYANLLTMSNAYRSGAAMSFASVIQNTPTASIVDPIRRWAAGSDPRETPLLTLGREDEDAAPQDRSNYSAVVEIYGFLNLAHAPFYNLRAELYRQWFDLGPEGGPYELMERVGSVTRAWLSEHESAVPRLARLFASMISTPTTTKVELESISRPHHQHWGREGGEYLLDTRFLEELDREARTALIQWEQPLAAAAALHLLLDAFLYCKTSEPIVVEPPPPPPEPRPKPPRPPEEPRRPTEERILPEGLRAPGERALSYLRAGLHVLFAGAPGTGKTTLAQFVGHAWNHDLALLSERVAVDKMPLTTVGNSAWSPFHTIGGLVPNQSGEFVPHIGIFLDPACAGQPVWRLRDSAIVLDEMNRADLDRCIGELYPLLSGSVDRVVPAGLPGIDRIDASPRFRVLATVNDSTVDDIVFPISEGLARRFQRIELGGASRGDVVDFLGASKGAGSDLRTAMEEAVALFFDVAKERKLLVTAEDDDRLPFGVGYFMLLRAWMDGRLQSPLPNATVVEQARDLLAGSLRTLGRTKAWEEALRDFLTRT